MYSRQARPERGDRVRWDCAKGPLLSYRLRSNGSRFLSYVIDTGSNVPGGEINRERVSLDTSTLPPFPPSSFPHLWHVAAVRSFGLPFFCPTHSESKNNK